MIYTNRHMTNRGVGSWKSWLLMSLLLVCLTACSSSGDDEMEEQNPEAANGSNVPGNAPTKLYIYVYAPEAPEVTRAAYGGQEVVDPITGETSVYSLQIWVFTHDTNQLLGYYSSTQPSSLSTANPSELIQMTIDETYAQKEAGEREPVDVYVAANVENSNCNLTLDGLTTQAQLEAALIQKTTADPFGVTNPISSVPENVGLPMSGVVRDLSVTGSAPVLRLDNGSGGIATVQLVRAVSKLRFAFSRQTGGESLTINSIKLNTEMLPIAEYLFMSPGAPYDGRTCHIKTGSEYDYETETPNLLSNVITDIAENADPVIYAWGYDEAEPDVYEARIETAAQDGYLTQRVFYLRESNKLLTGTIKYQIGEGEEQTATFRMVDEGGFSRNHVWTVYAYLAEAKLKVIVAEVAPWRPTETNYEFYNW